MKNVLPLFCSVLVLSLLLAGCDSAGTEGTAVLNATSPVPPTVEYEFRYTSENVNGQQVEVVSENSDNLGPVLTQNGFSRADVVSARVDSVTLRRQSSPASIRPKVFNYLSGAEVYLGADDSGKRIADDEFATTQQEISLRVSTSDVTEEVKGGSTRAFLRLEASDDVPSNDVVDVTVYYRIEVGGV
jgi:hypothetical protein